MNNTKCLLDINYIIATLLKTNKKYYGRLYVSIDDCRKLKQIIIDELKNINVQVEVTQDIDSNCFSYFHKIFIQKDGDDDKLDLFIEKYKNMTSPQAVSILEDLEYIDNIIYFKENEQEISFTPMKLESIIDKIVANPKVFYEQIAGCLSKEEIEYIKRFVVKSCFSCENNTCHQRNEYSVNNCPSWNNQELIGRAKMLKKDHE